MTGITRAVLLGVSITISSSFIDQGTADEVQRPSADALKKVILTRTPETRAKKIDRERLTVRRIDIVGDDGVIRMTLAAPTPAPILDGIQYKRAFPVSGLTIYDKNGNERGGYGVADIDGSAVVNAQDHINGDAIGWRIMPDGSVSFVMNERAPVAREPAIGNAIIPAAGSTRIEMNVATDGTPTISVADKQSRPRVRLTVTKEGYGAIEFLDAQGKVVEMLSPEAQRAAARKPETSGSN